MNRPNSVILGLAYILGLLSTGLVDFSPQLNRWQEVVIRIVILSLITLLTTIFIRRFWWQSPPSRKFDRHEQGMQGDTDSHYTRKYIAILGHLSTLIYKKFSDN